MIEAYSSPDAININSVFDGTFATEGGKSQTGHFVVNAPAPRADPILTLAIGGAAPTNPDRTFEMCRDAAANTGPRTCGSNATP